MMKKLNEKVTPHSRAATDFVVPGLLLIATIVGIYWKIFASPLIQDDWFIVDSISKVGNVTFLKDAFGRIDATFYRPLGYIYFFLNYNLFGLNSEGFHTIALAVHFMNSLLVAYIAFKLTSDKILAWMSAFLYASAVTVHLDTLVWMVGIYDAGGAFFFLLTCSLFLNDRRGYSAIAFCAAILTKESTIVTPLILLGLSLFRNGEKARSGLRQAIQSILPHLIILAAYLGVRYQSIASPVGAESAAYSMHIFGPHLLRNAQLYATWLSDAFVPFVASQRSPWIFAVMMLFIFSTQRRRRKAMRMLSMFGVWIFFGILPAFVLQNHAYRYYLVYSLPAFAMILSFAVRAFSTLMKLGERQFTYLIVAVLTINVAVSFLYVTGLGRKGIDAPSIDGSNNLLRKGLIVNMTKEFLEREGPRLPHGATLLFDWLPTISFGVKIGPGIWCHDSTISVYEVKRDSAGMHIHDPVHPDFNPPILSFLETGFLLRFHGGDLDIIRLSDL